MVGEVIEALINNPDGIYVDGTVGSGGHSEAIGERISSQGRLICLDRDPEAIRLSGERLRRLGGRVTLINASYAEMGSLVEERGIGPVDGIFLDLGLSSYQLDLSGRGFSFNRDEPLDMRMDPKDDVTASHLVNRLPTAELEGILREYGEERRARAISISIDRLRRKAPIQTSLQLADLIRSVIPKSHRPGAKDPATRTFQALRIAVNRELENLRSFLNSAPSMIVKGGRLVLLSYHSLEDRMVKQAMKGWERGCICPPDLPACACNNIPLFRILYKRGLRPGREETGSNPRARSATLRAAERT